MKAIRQICSVLLIGIACFAMSMSAKAESKTITVENPADFREALNNTDTSVEVLTVKLGRTITLGTSGKAADTVVVKSAAAKGKIILDLNGFSVRATGEYTNGVAFDVRTDLTVTSNAASAGGINMSSDETADMVLFKLSDAGSKLSIEKGDLLVTNRKASAGNAKAIEMSAGYLYMYGGTITVSAPDGESAVYSNFTGTGGVRISGGELSTTYCNKWHVVDDATPAAGVSHTVSIYNAKIVNANKCLVYSRFLNEDSRISLTVDGKSKSLGSCKNSSGAYKISGYQANFSCVLFPEFETNLNTTKTLNAGNVNRVTFKIANLGDVKSVKWYQMANGSSSWTQISVTESSANVYSLGSAICAKNGAKYRVTITMKDGGVYYSNIMTLTVKHSANTKYESDEDGHWHPCRGCDSYVYDRDRHSFENYFVKKATATADGIIGSRCSVCGYVSDETWSYYLELDIVEEPSDLTVNAGETATFSLKAKGTGITSYQWKKSTDGGKTWVNSSSAGAKTDTLTMTAKESFNNFLFKCVIGNDRNEYITSNVAKLTVKTQGLAISGQPKSQTVEAGKTVSFSIAATGEGLTYRWKKSTDGGKTWVNSSSTGAATNTLTMTTKASYNGLQFKCVVTDKNGKSVTSNAAILTVTAAGTTTLAITGQPANQSVTAGATATFKVTAAGEGLTYQWKKSTDGGKTWVNSASTGAKTNTLTMSAKASYNGLKFRCVIADKNGKTVISNAVTLTVK